MQCKYSANKQLLPNDNIRGIIMCSAVNTIQNNITLQSDKNWH